MSKEPLYGFKSFHKCGLTTYFKHSLRCLKVVGEAILCSLEVAEDLNTFSVGKGDLKGQNASRPEVREQVPTLRKQRGP